MCSRPIGQKIVSRVTRASLREDRLADAWLYCHEKIQSLGVGNAEAQSGRGKAVAAVDVGEPIQPVSHQHGHFFKDGITPSS